MKKTLSIILVVSMLLVMIPTMVVSVAAEDVPTTVVPTTEATKIANSFAGANGCTVFDYVDVNEVVSSTSNYSAYVAREVQWGEIWDTACDDKEWDETFTNSSHGHQSSAKLTADGTDGLLIKTVGKMEKASTLTGVVIQTWQSRLGAPKIRLSTDNETWDVAVEATSNVSTGQSGVAYVYFEFPDEYKNKEYEYVEFSIEGVANSVYQIVEVILLREDSRVSVTRQSGSEPVGLPTNLEDIPVLPYSSTSHTSAWVAGRDVQFNEVWDTIVDDKDIKIADTNSSHDYQASVNLANAGNIEIVGVMEKVSTVKKIYLQTYMARFNVTISLSKDNVTYDEVISFEKKNLNNPNGWTWAMVAIDVPEEYANTEYKYVKISASGNAGSIYQLCECVLYTDPVTVEDGVPNVYVGVQSKSYTHDTKGDCYAVRFLQTVDESVLTGCTSAGFEITAGYGGETTKDCSKDTNTVYTSVIAAGETLDAADLKKSTDAYTHEYIVALSVIDIAVDTYDNIMFTVKPYVVKTTGEKVYAGEYTVIYNDGVNMSVYQNT